jgi:glucose-6-phosphate dehydrogenase assembly protein OpcA
VTDEAHGADAEAAATHAAAHHPCRLLVVVRRRPDAPESRLDAEVLIGGRLGPGEAVVMRMYGRLALHAESVVLPLLAPDAPVVTWWYSEPPYKIAHDPLGVLAGRRITDCALAPVEMAALQKRAADYAPGDTDLGWTRTTLWRALCASAFDSVQGPVRSAKVIGAAGHVTRALLAGWLSSRLGIEAEQVDAEGTGLSRVELELDGTSISISRGLGTTAVLTRTGQPDRTLPLPRRDLGELLAEELRRLDPDEPYAEALEAATGTSGLSDRSPHRTHEWHDPVESDDPDPALSMS